MNDIEKYVSRVAEHFEAQLGPSLLEVYKLGSLAHGGFSQIYSDIDVGVLLNCAELPPAMSAAITDAKALEPEYGKKLSVFWGNPEHDWGRLPVIDRLDLLDHGIPLLNHYAPSFSRPAKDEIRSALRESIERSWKPRIPELEQLQHLEAKDRKPYIRCLLYPARLIYTWDCLTVDSNDRAVAYLHQVQPAGLDLKPIDMALACRQEKCTAEEVFALRTDLQRQFEAAFAYISGKA